MADDKNETKKVGLFVLTGLVLLAISIILIGGDKFLFKSQYQLNVNFEQVQGLGVGSVVSYAGIPIGNVKVIKFDNERQGIVLTLNLDDEYQPLITMTSVASVRTQGALGDKYIYIEPGTLPAKALNEGDFLTADTDGDILDMIKEKGVEFSRVIETADELKKIFQQLNAEGRVRSIAQHMDELLVESTLLVKDVRGKGELSRSFARLESILQKVDQSQGTLGALINDPTIHEQLVKIMGGSKRSNYLKPLIRATIQSQEAAPQRN